MKMTTVFKLGFVGLILMTSLSLASVTIASFADPSANSNDPLFTLVTDAGGSGTLSGGWDDSKTGLDLQIFENNAVKETLTDVFFVMDDLAYTGLPVSPYVGTTTGGAIKFFADNADPLVADPLFMITFDSASVSIGGISGGDTFFSSDNVVFSGTAIQNAISDEVFSFNLVNQLETQDGFTATASFDSSATVPEPVSLGLMLMGLGVLRGFPRK